MRWFYSPTYVHVSSCRVGRSREFSSSNRPYRLWNPPFLLVSWFRGSVLGLLWPGCDVDHGPPPNVEVKNEQNCTSTPPPHFPSPHMTSVVWTGTGLPLRSWTIRVLPCVLHEPSHAPKFRLCLLIKSFRFSLYTSYWICHVIAICSIWRLVCSDSNHIFRSL